MAVAGLLAGAASLSAQAPQAPEGAGKLPEMPKILNPEEKTADMAEKYGLTEEQQAAVLELNKQYDGKLEFRPEPMGEQKDFRSMTEAERQEFFDAQAKAFEDCQGFFFWSYKLENGDLAWSLRHAVERGLKVDN